MTHAVRTALAKQVGLAARTGSRSELGNAIARVAGRHALDARFASTLVANNADWVREVAEQLSLGESYFFRGPEQLDLVSRRLFDLVRVGCLPRVWSAGCARGEELFSTLAALRELDAEAPNLVAAFGTDLNRAYVEQARRGEYGPWSLRDTEPERVARHFEETAPNLFRIKEPLRTAVRFQHATIQEQLLGLAPDSCDIVLFRNVGIYLTPAALRTTTRALVSVLRPGGWLVVAATDPLSCLTEHPGLRAVDVGIFERVTPD